MVVDFYFHHMKITVGVSRITENRLQIHSLMEQRNTNHGKVTIEG